jgi:capsular polysaccharide biosynthesis protein
VAVEPYRERIEDFMRRWRSRYEGDRVFRVLVVKVVLAAYAVTSSGLQQTLTYEASALVLVAQGQWDERPGPIPKRIVPPQQLAQTIVHAIDSRPVAQETLLRLGLQMDPSDLLDNVTVEQVENTRFIVLTYEGTDPYKAKRIVNTLGAVSSEFAQRSSTLTAKVWEKASVPESPVSPNPLRNGLLTLVIGLVFCAGTVVVLPGVGARVAGTLGERPSRQGIGQAGLLDRRHSAPSIVEGIKEQELLRALGRHRKLTAVEASLESSLSVEEANRMLFDLAARGHLELTVEHGKLLYSFWGSTEYEDVAVGSRGARP